MARVARRSMEAQALGNPLPWGGIRRDTPDVCFASDVVILTSDNDGTPVSLIEARRSAVPVVATDMAGVARRCATVRPACSWLPTMGTACARGGLDPHDRELASRMGAAGGRHAGASYAVDRLVDDHPRLYRGPLEARAR